MLYRSTDHWGNHSLRSTQCTALVHLSHCDLPLHSISQWLCTLSLTVRDKDSEHNSHNLWIYTSNPFQHVLNLHTVTTQTREMLTLCSWGAYRAVFVNVNYSIAVTMTTNVTHFSENQEQSPHLRRHGTCFLIYFLNPTLLNGLIYCSQIFFNCIYTIGNLHLMWSLIKPDYYWNLLLDSWGYTWAT